MVLFLYEQEQISPVDGARRVTLLWSEEQKEDRQERLNRLQVDLREVEMELELVRARERELEARHAKRKEELVGCRSSVAGQTERSSAGEQCQHPPIRPRRVVAPEN